MRLIFTALLALLLTACAGTAENQAQLGLTETDAFATNQDHSKETAIHQALKKSSPSKTIDLDNASVDSLASNDGDLWGRIRKGFQMDDLNGDLVEAQTRWYSSRPDYVQRMTDRSRLYLYHIVEQLEQRHMPTELALLPFIESAYNPQALSVAKAAGMWQFIPGTGRDYNLKQNMFQDERRDVLASTDAALDYLSRLHDMFGDWYLALAAYNWGEGNVQRAISRNAAQGLPTDYQSLRMPAETRNYVPKLQAVKNLVENPAQYGLTLPSIPNHPYFVTVTTARDIDVKVAAKLADLPLDDFKALNPSFTKPVILGSTQPQILLPFDSAETFDHNLKTYSLPLSSWTTYRVSQRERPSDLADKIGIDAQTLISVNKIPAGMRLKPGSTVLVPKADGDGDGDISADIAESAVMSVEPDRPDMRRLTVRLSARESASSVASRYGVSTAQLHNWNRTRASSFRAGTRLVMYVRADRDDLPRVMPLDTVPVGDDGPKRGIMRASARIEAPTAPVQAPVPPAPAVAAPANERRTTGAKRFPSRAATSRAATSRAAAARETSSRTAVSPTRAEPAKASTSRRADVPPKPVAKAAATGTRRTEPVAKATPTTRGAATKAEATDKRGRKITASR
ncbi:MAG: transglycosylase SLT domain-containing protein [Janthinobacterium lividum]